MEAHEPARDNLSAGGSGAASHGNTRLTHETVANHLGTAREVVTRTLKYLWDEGCVELAREIVRIKDAAALERLQK